MKMIVAIESSGRRATDAEYYRDSFGLDIFEKLFDVEIMSAAGGSDIHTQAVGGNAFANEGRRILQRKAEKEDIFLYSAPIYWGPYMTKGLDIKTVVRYGLSVENLKLCEKDACNHAHYLRYYLAKWLRQAFWHNNVWFHAVSKAMKKELLKFGIPASRVGQVYSIPDTRKYIPGKGRNESNEFLFVTQNLKEKRKEPEMLIDAALELRKTKIDARFLCTGYNRKWFYQKIISKDKMLLDKFELMELVQRSELTRLYQSSYYGVHPTLIEGFPRSVLEGMSCGLPWLSTCAEGMDEIIDKYNGMFFSSGADLADTISFLLDNRKIRKKMSIGARQKMVAMRKPLLRQYKNFFQEVGVL